jgi:hypothetical protein
LVIFDFNHRRRVRLASHLKFSPLAPNIARAQSVTYISKPKPTHEAANYDDRSA